jgi:hypothetical protein
MKVSIIYWGGLTDIIAYARVVILLRLCLLEQCLDPVFRLSNKTCNFVTFYEFLIHLGVHHTNNWLFKLCHFGSGIDWCCLDEVEVLPQYRFR